MGNYGALTAKRHVAWSNDQMFLHGLVQEGGFMSAGQRKLLGPSNLTNRKWDARVGKLRVTGCRTALRDSQFLALDMLLSDVL